MTLTSLKIKCFVSFYNWMIEWKRSLCWLTLPLTQRYKKFTYNTRLIKKQWVYLKLNIHKSILAFYYFDLWYIIILYEGKEFARYANNRNILLVNHNFLYVAYIWIHSWNRFSKNWIFLSEDFKKVHRKVYNMRLYNWNWYLPSE